MESVTDFRDQIQINFASSRPSSLNRLPVKVDSRGFFPLSVTKIALYCTAVVVGVLLILLSEYSVRAPDFYDGSVDIDGQTIRTIDSLPYFDDEGKENRILYNYTLHLDGTDSSYWRVIADNKVERIVINGVEVDLSQVPEDRLQDYMKGFQYLFSPYLVDRVNTIEISARNFGGRASLKIERLGYGKDGWLTRMLSVVGFLLLCAPLIGRVTNVKIRCVFVIAVAIVGYYNAYTAFTVNEHDVFAHIDYVEYIINNKIPPPPFGGWEYHQPPLYYYLAAPFYLLATTLPWLEAGEFLQYFSSFASVVFLFFGIKSCEMVMGARGIRLFWAALLLGFWCSFVIHSARVGNDPLYYAFSACAFYYILRWWHNKRLRNFIWAAVWTSCAIMTKANGVVLVATAGTLYLIYLWEKESRKFWLYKIKQGLLAGVIILIGGVVSFGDSAYYKLVGNASDTLLGDSIKSLNPGLFVNNEPRNYLMFDPQTFVTEPYAYVWEDKGGRQYFWNYLLKTSLFGNHEYPKEYHQTTAKFISAVYIVMLWVVLVALYRLRWDRRYWPHYALAGFSLIALLTFKIKAPAAPHGDFRFILPTLIVLATFFVSGINERRVYARGNLIRFAIAGLMVCGNVAFLIYPQG